MELRSQHRVSHGAPDDGDLDDDMDEHYYAPAAAASSTNKRFRRANLLHSISSSSARDPNDPSAWPDEITLDYFYKPHTISILLLSVAGLVFTAFYRCPCED